jgi:hypothetical protein
VYVNISETTCRLTIALNAVVDLMLIRASKAAMREERRMALLGISFLVSTFATQFANGKPRSLAKAKVCRAVLARSLYSLR